MCCDCDALYYGIRHVGELNPEIQDRKTVDATSGRSKALKHVAIENELRLSLETNPPSRVSRYSAIFSFKKNTLLQRCRDA